MRRHLGGGMFFHGRQDGRFVVETAQDVAPILDRNKGLATRDDGYSPSRELRRAASIPLVVVQIWRDRFGVDLFDPDHRPAVRRLLNDPEWRWLRTAEGRL